MFLFYYVNQVHCDNITPTSSKRKSKFQENFKCNLERNILEIGKRKDLALCNSSDHQIQGKDLNINSSNLTKLFSSQNLLDLNEITMEKLLAIHYSFIQSTAKLETKVATYFDLNFHMQLKFTNEFVSQNLRKKSLESKRAIQWKTSGPKLFNFNKRPGEATGVTFLHGIFFKGILLQGTF